MAAQDEHDLIIIGAVLEAMSPPSGCPTWDERGLRGARTRARRNLSLWDASRARRFSSRARLFSVAKPAERRVLARRGQEGDQ